MKRIALLLLALVTLVAGSVGQPVAAAKEPAVVHATALLAVVGGEVEQPRLVWLEPETLRQLKRGVVKLDGSQNPVLSPTGKKVAVGSSGLGIRIADVRRMKLLRGTIAKQSGWTVSPVVWPAARRLLALEWHERLPGQRLLVADPMTRRAVKRIAFDGYSLWRSTGSALVAVGGPSDAIGPARVLVVDKDGETRTVSLERIPAGGLVEAEADAEPTYRVAAPGLAVDRAIGHAYVVGESPLVADIDLATLGVTYHELSRRASLFGRFLDWLQPAAHAKYMNGWQRLAVSFGDGQLAVAGSEYDGLIGGASGLELVDLRSDTIRRLGGGASYVLASSGVLLAAGESRVGTADDDWTGMGVAAYTPDGEELWHVLDGEPVGWLQAVGGYAYIGGPDGYPRTVRVVDLATGVVQTRRGELPFFVTS
jgi:hypothetical protein